MFWACRFIFILIFMQALSLQAAEKKNFQDIKFTSSETILKWINNYRSAPNPNLLPQAVQAMVRLGQIGRAHV